MAVTWWEWAVKAGRFALASAVLCAPVQLIAQVTFAPSIGSAMGGGATTAAPAAAPAGNPGMSQGTAPGAAAGVNTSPSLRPAAAPDVGALRNGAAARSALDARGQADARTDGKALPGEQRSSADARATADAKIDAKNAESNPSAAESVKEAAADQIEFQRFVFNATGQALRLYGYELFNNPTSYASVQAAPVPAGYILGPGDELVVQVNGLAEINERLVIDRDGRVQVPRVGPLNLAGVPLSNAEKVFTAHIGKVFRNFTVSVTMGRLRSIEVFVVGQARKPGKHLVSSLSSLINALFETGGPGANGSLRAIELRRAGKKIATVDLYAFLANGNNTADAPLMAGDIIFIPPAGPRAALLGTLNAPAIYELAPRETIDTILQMSGGLPTLAAPQKAQLERVDATREIARYVDDFALDAAGLAKPLKAGDILTIFQISPQIANVVTLQGNVAAPLRYSFKPGLRVADLLSDKRLLIPGSYWLQLNQGATTGNYSRPEVNLDYATIQRLDPATLRTRVIAFNLVKAIALDASENLALESGDIVTVYKPGDAGPETENSIAINGEIVGGTRRFVWRPGFTIRDVIPSAQWLIDYYSYWQRPSAKSLRDDINWDYAQIIRQVPATLSTRAITFNLGQAVLLGDPANNIALQPGDQIALFTTSQLAVPLEKRTQMVTLQGEVMVPGRYQIKAGETLPDLIKRAGGLSQNAFAYGLVFTRESTRAQQQENLEKSIRRIEADINSQISSSLQNVRTDDKGGDNAGVVQAQVASQKLALSRLQGLRASGRIALDLDPNNPALPPIALEDGDQIILPSRPSFVGVFGEVFAETSFLHKPAYTVADYIDKSGLTRDADTDSLLLIRADGSVEGGAQRSSWFGSSMSGKKLNPGDAIFVPAVLDRRTGYSKFIEGAKDWTSILYQFGLGAAALKTLKSIN